MGELANHLATRLLIEQSYEPLTDRDNYPVLPEEKQFVALYEKQTTDDARQGVLDEWLAAEREFLKKQPVVGGSLEGLHDLIDRDAFQDDVLLTSRTLRSLTRDCSRVMVQPRLSPMRVAVIVEGEIPPALDPANLAAASRQIQEELDFDPWDDGPIDEAVYRRPMLYELIVVDASNKAEGHKRRLTQLARRSRKTPGVTIRGYYLNSETGQGWSTARFADWRQRAFLSHALRNPPESGEALIRSISDQGKPWMALAAVPAIALATIFLIKALLPSLDSWAMLPRDIGVPVVVLMLACLLRRRRLHTNTLIELFPAIYSLLFLVVMATINVAATGSFRWNELFDLLLYTAYCFVGIQFLIIPVLLFMPANRTAVP